jgi:hypothetical protein
MLGVSLGLERLRLSLWNGWHYLSLKIHGSGKLLEIPYDIVLPFLSQFCPY